MAELAQTNHQNHRPEADVREARSEPTLADIFFRLMSAKWFVLVSYALVLAAVALSTYRQAPVYQASSLILITNESSTPQLIDLIGLSSGSRNVANEIAIIRSRTISLRVADALMDWQTVPGTSTQLSVLRVKEGSSAPTQMDVAGRLMGDFVSVSQVNPLVDLIEITVRSTVPREAALIADMYADEFLSYNRARSRRRFKVGVEFLQGQAQRFDTLLVNAETNILNYSEEQGIVDPRVEAEALLQQVMALESERYQTEFLLRATQSELQTLESELNRIIPGLHRTLSSYEDEQIIAIRARVTALQLDNASKLSLNPDLRLNPSIDEQFSDNLILIEDFTNELTALSASYTNELISSGRIALGTDSRAAFERVAALENTLITKRIEITGAQARRDVVDQQLSLYREQLDRIPNKAIMLARVQREMDTSAQLYTTIFQSLQEARIAEASTLGYVEKIDHAVVPTGPISPSIPRNLMLGAGLGLMLGLMVALISSALDNKVTRPEDLREKGYSVLGIVPDMREIIQTDFAGASFIKVGNTSVSTSLMTLLSPLSQAAEAFRRVRTNVDYSAPDSSRKIILITSAEPGEGKTSISLNLAISNAQLGRKTLFIDADMRRPSSHKLMDISREPGLVDWLFDENARKIESISTHVENLYLLPTGKAAPNPAELLGSRRMQELVQQLATRFDTIIIDSPPLLSVSDALLIAPAVDMVIQIVFCGETHWAALEQAQEVLRDAHIVSAGFILNRFDYKRAYGGYYGYGYGSVYRYGYGYGSDSAELYADREMQQVLRSGRST